MAAEILENGETAQSVIRDAAKMSSGGTNRCPSRPKRRQEAKEEVLGRLVKSAKRKRKQKPLQHRLSPVASMQFFDLFIQRVTLFMAGCSCSDTDRTSINSWSDRVC